MSAVLFVLKRFVFFSNESITMALITVIIYTIVGALIYFGITKKFKMPEEILGDNYMEKLLQKFKIGGKRV